MSDSRFGMYFSPTHSVSDFSLDHLKRINHEPFKVIALENINYYIELLDTHLYSKFVSFEQVQLYIEEIKNYHSNSDPVKAVNLSEHITLSDKEISKPIHFIHQAKEIIEARNKVNPKAYNILHALDQHLINIFDEYQKHQQKTNLSIKR